MARGFVSKRGDTWYAYWRNAEGKQKAKAIGTRKKDAEAYLAKIHTELNDGVYRDIQKITLPKFARMWLDDYVSIQVKPSTLESYEIAVRHWFIPAFGDVQLTAISRVDVQKMVSDGIKAGKAPATVKRALVVLRSMLKQAVLWGYLKQNPAEGIKAPKDTRREATALAPHELRTLLDAFDGQWYAFFFTAAFTGMRLGELCGLKWSDIEWNKRVIHVRRGIWKGEFQKPKTTNSTRAIGMSERLIGVLQDHRENCIPSDLDLVFPNERGGLLDTRNVRKRVFESTLERIEFRKVRIHDLRHTYASLLINQGENLKYVQHQLGHASITTTADRYGHLIPEMNSGAVSRLDASVFGSA